MRGERRAAAGAMVVVVSSSRAQMKRNATRNRVCGSARRRRSSSRSAKGVTKRARPMLREAVCWDRGTAVVGAALRCVCGYEVKPGHVAARKLLPYVQLR